MVAAGAGACHAGVCVCGARGRVRMRRVRGCVRVGVAECWEAEKETCIFHTARMRPAHEHSPAPRGRNRRRMPCVWRMRRARVCVCVCVCVCVEADATLTRV
jgi:hypothetical protein